MGREYKDFIDPKKYPEGFNEYLRNNNVVVEESEYWIIVNNSFIKGQLVAFSKLPVADAKELYAADVVLLSGRPNFQVRTEAILELGKILSTYPDKKVYINALEDRSVPNRWHIHIVDRLPGVCLDDCLCMDCA